MLSRISGNGNIATETIFSHIEVKSHDMVRYGWMEQDTDTFKMEVANGEGNLCKSSGSLTTAGATEIKCQHLEHPSPSFLESPNFEENLFSRMASLQIAFYQHFCANLLSKRENRYPSPVCDITPSQVLALVRFGSTLPNTRKLRKSLKPMLFL